MSLKEWAEKEVEIACKKERGDRPEYEWDYGCACYESALKAFNILMEDGHSGMSIGFTKQILNRLIDGKPLTPIEDTDDIWKECTRRSDGKKTYQCKRMSSLFKDVYPSGEVSYHDIDRFVCIDVNDEENRYYNGLVDRTVREMFPIEMPYIPLDKPYTVICEDFLYNPKNGDFDTVGIYNILTPDGRDIFVGKYFKEDEKSGEWIEIVKSEYFDRHINFEKIEREIKGEME